MAQEPPSDAPDEHLVESHAFVLVRPSQKTTSKTAGKKGAPGSQRRASGQVGAKPAQKSPARKQSKTLSTVPSASRVGEQTQRPTSKKTHRAPAVSGTLSRRAELKTKQLLLGVAGGLVGGIIGAFIFAFLFPQAVNVQSFTPGFLAPPTVLSVLVGWGVRLGARRQHINLALLAGVLGLLSLLLAFNFGLSLVYVWTLGLRTNFFALPLGRIFDNLKILLQHFPAFYGYFVSVPFLAGFIGRGGSLGWRWQRR